MSTVQFVGVLILRRLPIVEIEDSLAVSSDLKTQLGMTDDSVLVKERRARLHRVMMGELTRCWR